MSGYLNGTLSCPSNWLKKRCELKIKNRLTEDSSRKEFEMCLKRVICIWKWRSYQHLLCYWLMLSYGIYCDVPFIFHIIYFHCDISFVSQCKMCDFFKNLKQSLRFLTWKNSNFRSALFKYTGNRFTARWKEKKRRSNSMNIIYYKSILFGVHK